MKAIIDTGVWIVKTFMRIYRGWFLLMCGAFILPLFLDDNNWMPEFADDPFDRMMQP